MKTLFIIILAFMVTACRKQEEPHPVQPVQQIPVPSLYKPMSNDDIISETRKCENAGLDAQGLTVTEFGELIVIIQCTPREQVD